ncbi:ATP-binding cassette domain-containing protein [bacterium]|nr:ATP-binding cassette domain-containing protein [bacterium]
MIEVRQLSRRFGQVQALDDVSFRVSAGEVAGFLGPNGAGKSTCMKILTGSLAPGGGKVRIGDVDVAADPVAAQRLTGFMPEHVPLYPENTVLEFLRFVAALKGVARRDVRAHLDRIVQRCHLEEVTGRLIGHLSKGFRQRVGLAQALVGDPPVLILDEPTSGLDPHQIVEIRELVRGLRGETTVLLSSHILVEVSQVCDRVVILDRGRVVAERAGHDLATDDDLGTVVLTWDGNREEVARSLAEVAGDDAVTLTAEGAEVVIAGNPVEIKPRLVESVVRAGGKLQGLEERGPTLEDLFLRLTGAMPEPDPGDGRMTPRKDAP